MSAALEVLACPLPASLQDLGRPGYRHLGVPLSGALDPDWLQLANALAGNAPGAAAIEMRLAGPTLRASGELTVALAGDLDARLDDGNGERPIAAWRSHRLRRGDVLRIAAVRSGVAYLAVAGGFAGRVSLGSRSGYRRAGLGETVDPGITLNVDAGGTAAPQQLPEPPDISGGPLRILPGPQRDHFSPAAWEALLDGEFEVSRESDRMGLRLAGPPLPHISAAAADTVSDAVTPGVIQVPGDGRAILLLADCQTVGGYPKIAVVIGADLPRLAHCLPGSRLRFAEVSADAALLARREQRARLDAAIGRIAPVREGPDLDALYAANLIDGAIYAD